MNKDLKLFCRLLLGGGRLAQSLVRIDFSGLKCLKAFLRLFFTLIDYVSKLNYNFNIMNYSLSNKKIKSGIFNKVAMALCQNNLLTNLFHTTRHSERRCYARRHIRFAFTRHPEALAEGATHVGMSNNNRRAAFTLAEVLITLGIIGIVAAMTIPTLISNYNKRQTVTKLKQTYSILSQALTMAQVKEGDTSTWDVGGIYGTSTDDPNFSSREATEKFVSKYLIPYVKVSKDYGYTWPSQINYDGYYNPSTNT